MPTRHNTRSAIADVVPEIEYEKYRDRDGLAEGVVVLKPERRFTKAELARIHEFLCNAHYLERAPVGNLRKSAVRDGVRGVMDELGYDGFGEEKCDGKELRARELLTILTGVKDGKENLRWDSEAPE